MNMEKPTSENTQNEVEKMERESKISAAAHAAKVVGERVEHTFYATSNKEGDEYTEMRIQKVRELEEVLKNLKGALGIE